MKKFVSPEQLNRIYEANEQAKGLLDFSKYHMCLECKFKSDGKWTGWKYMTWTIPSITGTYYFKTVKGKLYMMRDLDLEVERFEVTPIIKNLLNLKEN